MRALAIPQDGAAFTSKLLKKPHMLRCTRPIRFNVLKRTPQLIERRAPYL